LAAFSCLIFASAEGDLEFGAWEVAFPTDPDPLGEDFPPGHPVPSHRHDPELCSQERATLITNAIEYKVIFHGKFSCLLNVCLFILKSSYPNTSECEKIVLKTSPSDQYHW
jgi:hypothetical protein